MKHFDKIFYILLGTVLLTFGAAQHQNLAFANCAQPCDDAQIPPADTKKDTTTNQQGPQDSGPPLTDKQLKNPKDIKITGQNKCQTLDGFSASEPCPSGSHHTGSHHSSKHHLTSSSGPKIGALIPYNNPDYKISILYPSNWKISEENLGSHQVVKISAQEVTQKQTKVYYVVFTPAYLLVSVEPLASNSVTLSQHVTQFFNLWYHNPTNYKIVNSSNTMLAGIPAQKIIMYDYMNNHTSEVMRLIGVDNGTAYRIAYYAEPGTFSTYVPVIQQMIASFRINTGLTG